MIKLFLRNSFWFILMLTKSLTHIIRAINEHLLLLFFSLTCIIHDFQLVFFIQSFFLLLILLILFQPNTSFRRSIRIDSRNLDINYIHSYVNTRHSCGIWNNLTFKRADRNYNRINIYLSIYAREWKIKKKIHYAWGTWFYHCYLDLYKII